MFCLCIMPLFFSECLWGFSKQYFLWESHTVYFEHIHLPTSPYRCHSSTLLLFPTQLWDCFFLLFPWLVQFVWPSESWEWGLPWHGVILLWVTFLQKTDSSSPSDHQMSITSWLPVRLCSLFLASVLGLCLTGAWAGLTSAATVAMRSYVNLSSRVWEAQFLDIIHHLCLSPSFCPLCPEDFWDLGEGCDWIQGWACHSLLHTEQLGVSVLAPSTERRGISDKGGGMC